MKSALPTHGAEGQTLTAHSCFQIEAALEIRNHNVERKPMAKRSLKASETGIVKAKRVFERRDWTQEYLASAVGLQTRQSIWKFFSGRPIERHLFIDICFQLDLDWQEIVDRPIGTPWRMNPSASP